MAIQPMVAQRSLLPKPAVKPIAKGSAAGMKVAGLFAGIGGIELGMHRAGHSTALLCEIEPGAQEVLKVRFEGVQLEPDVTTIASLPRSVDLLTAGFPCQDLSQAGRTLGIEGERSGLVGEVFRLLRKRRTPWVLLENVSFMLQLQRGRALEKIVASLEELGYSWAYRVVDSRFTGIPQRRERVYILASLEGDPRSVLLSEDSGPPMDLERTDWWEAPCGFYWTEGLRGLGWAFNSVPTLKGGSTVGIPSPPAIIFPNGSLAKPDIRDLERLQGFEPGWTSPAERVARPGHRWKLVGNAVTVDVANWIGRRLKTPLPYDDSVDQELTPGAPWPKSAWGIGGERFRSGASAWPEPSKSPDLSKFLQFPTSPLSVRAASGFMERAGRSSLRFPPRFLDAVRDHIRALA